MKINKNRELLIEEIKSCVERITEENVKLDEIIEHLKQYKITTGSIMKYINDAESLNSAPLEDLLLFAEQLNIKLYGHENERWINEWLNPSEIKELRIYKKDNESEEILTLPLQLENALPFGNNRYMVNIPNQLIAQMYRSGLIQYNPEIQREAKKIKSGNDILSVINLNPKNLEGIKKQVLNDDLLMTTLYYNCKPESSKDGVEMSYDKRSRKLTIHEGTIVDILDGSHRTVGIYNAYMENKDIKGSMAVMFTNVDEDEAKRFQVDRAKATPISKGRIKELANERCADIAVKRLKIDSDLKDRITSSETVKYSLGELVTYSTISDAIEKNFKLTNRIEAKNIGERLKEYFEYLFYYYWGKVSDESILFKNKMFIGHIYLAAQMLENNVPFTDLNKYIDKVDFNRSANIWTEYDVISNGSIARKSEKGILKIFKEKIWG